MKDTNTGYFFYKIYNKKSNFPFRCQFELTYRCNLDCVHCYCKGSENKNRELTAIEIKKILDEIHKEGCLEICFTGGEPLFRHDFLEIYAYARSKGFLIGIFTNGQLISKDIIRYLVKYPPVTMEITMNGITEETYESITQIKGSFLKAVDVIKKLAKTDIPVILKSNCLKQNKHEIGRIKAFAERLFGKPSPNRHRFKYDPMLYPRLNGDKAPCDYRLSFDELLGVRKQDLDLWKEYEKGLHSRLPVFERDKAFLYRCDSWMQQFFIDPYGQLKFCHFSNKFSVNLRERSFKDGFYNFFPKISAERYKTDSECRDCGMRPVCYQCPGRAYIETGDEEAPVAHYCELAKGVAGEIRTI